MLIYLESFLEGSLEGLLILNLNRKNGLRSNRMMDAWKVLVQALQTRAVVYLPQKCISCGAQKHSRGDNLYISFFPVCFCLFCFDFFFFLCGRVEGDPLPIIYKYALNAFLVLERKTKRECYLEAL